MNLRTLALPLLLSTAAFLGGCKKDPCKDVSCQNGGSCADGTCVCPAGFEGADCGVSQRTKFLGSYNVSESCTSGNASFQMQIATSSTGATAIIFSNFYGIGMSVNGTINGNSVTIPNQQSTVNGTAVTVSGSGQLSGSLLTLTYTLSISGASDTCTATCTKL